MVNSMRRDQSENKSSPRRRVVVLGASNVARGISTIVETAQLTFREPIEIMAAFGHGRSFGEVTTVFFRKISGIFFCGLWPALSDSQPLPTVALITDIGNDILYGVSNKTILQWLDGCVERLAQSGANTVITALPVDRISQISPRQFLFFRSMLFPRCRLPFEEVVARAYDLNQGVADLAQKRKISLIPQKNDWFGFDPIHIRRRCFSTAWSEILQDWTGKSDMRQLAKGSLRRWLYLHSLAPRERWICGLRQEKNQPAGALRDGSTIALY